MINTLFNPKKAERHPFEMFLIAFFYSSISIFLSLWVFPKYASLLMVFFAVISCLYVVQGAIKREESGLVDIISEGFVFRKHFRALNLFLFLFLGFVFSFSFWSLVLPESVILSLFDVQMNAIMQVRSITGNSVSSSPILSLIIGNNLKVLLISFVFAFFYGAGSIFILVWNSSVMGFVIGDLARNNLGFFSLPAVFLKYFLHGIPEMFAYISAALAGGLVFVALVRGDLFREGMRRRIWTDVFVLVLFSCIMIIFSALIEVYVSPLL